MFDFTETLRTEEGMDKAIVDGAVRQMVGPEPERGVRALGRDVGRALARYPKRAWEIGVEVERHLRDPMPDPYARGALAMLSSIVGASRATVQDELRKDSVAKAIGRRADIQLLKVMLDGPAVPSDLAARLGKDPAHISRVLKDLEEHGLVQAADTALLAEDGRRRPRQLTPLGYSAAADLIADASPSTWHLASAPAIEKFPGHRSDLSRRPRLSGGTDLSPSDVAARFLVPRSQNRRFVGRQRELDTLASGHAGIIHVLSGMPGVGKTETALEYAYRYGGEYDVVIWLRGNDEETFITECGLAVERLGLREQPQRADHRSALLLQQWLDEHDGWLLIVDGVLSVEPITARLPDSARGHVIVTSPLHTDWGRATVQVPVAPFSEREVRMFFSIRCPDWDTTLAQELSEELGRVPLALENAAAFCDQKGMKPNEYLAMYRQTDVGWSTSQTTAEADRQRISTTWNLSIDLVQQESRRAAELIQQLAFLASDDIPIELFTGDGPDHAIDEPTASDLDVLKPYSLLTEQRDGGVTMHRLIQQVLRDGLTESEARERVTSALTLVERHFDDRSTPMSSKLKARLLPHASAVLFHAERLHLATDSQLRLVADVGAYLRHRGRYAEAEQHLRRALDVPMAADVRRTAPIRLLLGEVLSDSGNVPGAQEMLERALEQFRELGDDVQIGRACTALASVWRDLGQCTQATRLHQEALDLAIRHGAGQETRRSLLVQLAIDALDSGSREDLKYAELTVSEALREVDDYDDPAAADLLAVRARLNREQGKPDLAQRDCEGLTRMLLEKDPDDPLLILTLIHLGIAQRELGDIALAEETQQRAHAMAVARYGEFHQKTAQVLLQLAWIDWELGHLQEALAKVAAAEDILRERLGPQHSDVGRALGAKGTILQDLARIDEAEKCARESLVILQRAYPNGHRDLAGQYDHLGFLQRKRGVWAKAGGNVERANALFAEAKKYHTIAIEALSGTQLSELGIFRANLALALMELDEGEASKREAEAAVKYLERTAPKHHNVAIASVYLGMILRRNGHLSAARDVLEQARLIFEAGEDRRRNLYDISVVSLELGRAWADGAESVPDRSGRFDAYHQALVETERACKEFEQILGPSHPDTVQAGAELNCIIAQQSGVSIDVAGKSLEFESPSAHGTEKVTGKTSNEVVTRVVERGLVDGEPLFALQGVLVLAEKALRELERMPASLESDMTTVGLAVSAH